VAFIPIPAGIPLLLSPLPRYYRGYRGITAIPISMSIFSHYNALIVNNTINNQLYF